MIGTTKSQQNPSSKNTFIHNRILWVIPLFLFVFGCIEILTASRFISITLRNNEFFFSILHIFWVVLAIGLGVVTSFIPSGFWKKTATIFYYITLVILIGVFFAPVSNGAHRWFPIAKGIDIQPSEFAKIVVIIYGAYLLGVYPKKAIRTYKEHLQNYVFPILIRVGIPLLLIVLEPDLGTAVVIFIAFLVMYLIKENKYFKQDLLLLGTIGLLALSIFSVIQSYRVTRIQSYIHLLTTGEVDDKFNTGNQIYNILIGVGSGGLWGKGIGQSRQRYGYLVEVTAFTDSISAVIFEELGLILSTIFFSLYYFYFRATIDRAKEQKDQFKKLVLWGCAIWIIGQTFFHLSANLALVPLKGIPLPFLTYGGSSILAIGIAAGIIYSFSRNTSGK